MTEQEKIYKMHKAVIRAAGTAYEVYQSEGLKDIKADYDADYRIYCIKLIYTNGNVSYLSLPLGFFNGNYDEARTYEEIVRSHRLETI